MKITKTIYIIIFYFVSTSIISAQENWLDVNDRNYQQILLKGKGFHIIKPTSENGSKIYSSYKPSNRSGDYDSDAIRQIYFQNGYPILFTEKRNRYFFKNPYPASNQVSELFFESTYSDAVEHFKYVEKEDSSENYFKTTSHLVDGGEIKQVFIIEKSEDEEKYRIVEITNQWFNYGKFPFFSALDENDNPLTLPKLIKVNTYNIEDMVKYFIKDLMMSTIGRKLTEKEGKVFSLLQKSDIETSFETLESGVLAKSFGMGNDNIIKIKVDPVMWEKSSNQKRWYIIYHELGHDVLNFNHGYGGRMMFNFVDKQYSWDDFFTDRKNMFDYFFKTI